MFISDLKIHALIKAGDLVIEPRLHDAHDIGPFSVELRLGTQFAEIGGFETSNLTVFDPLKKDFETKIQSCFHTKSIEIGESIILHPWKHLIATTLQFIQIPSNLCAFIFPRSAWTRVGLFVASSIVSPGFQGKLTISLNNVGEIPIAIYPSIRIAEIAFSQIDSPPLLQYNIKCHRGRCLLSTLILTLA